MRQFVKHTFRSLALAGVLLASSPVFAQEEGGAQTAESGDTEDRATTFRTSAGPQIDRVPGGKLLIGAYGLAWLAILGFMWFRIDRQQKRATGELERLASVVDRHLKKDGKS
ncbi:MAG: hypothetical protein ACI9KE_002943 [Polyangiales bacterium]|jgi:hypothetical protein